MTCMGNGGGTSVVSELRTHMDLHSPGHTWVVMGYVLHVSMTDHPSPLSLVEGMGIGCMHGQSWMMDGCPR
jgi:hypothetical protein